MGFLQIFFCGAYEFEWIFMAFLHFFKVADGIKWYFTSIREVISVFISFE